MSSLCLLTPSHPSLQDSQHISHTPVEIQTDILEVQIGHTHIHARIYTLGVGIGKNLTIQYVSRYFGHDTIPIAILRYK